MNKTFLVFSLISAACFSHADLRSEITAAHAKVEMASMSKDAKRAEAAYRESVTSDFKYVQGGKTQDFKTLMRNFLMSMTMTDKITSHSTRIVSLKETGSTATGKIERKMVANLKMQDKKPHVMNWTGQFTEEYRKVGGKWKTFAMIAGRQKFLMDGKPVKM